MNANNGGLPWMRGSRGQTTKYEALSLLGINLLYMVVGNW
jgi:hypothetical protein